MLNYVPDNYDLASAGAVGSRGGVIPLFIGAAQVVADSAPAKALFAKYEIAHLAVDGSGVEKFVPGTHEASRCVVVSQPVTVVGQAAVYWNEGYFNHEALVWPVDPALDTYVERKSFFTGTPLRVGHTI